MKWDIKVEVQGKSIVSDITQTDEVFDLGRTILRQVLDTQDRLVREKLVELGWTPPGDIARPWWHVLTSDEVLEVLGLAGEEIWRSIKVFGNPEVRYLHHLACQCGDCT